MTDWLSNHENLTKKTYSINFVINNDGLTEIIMNIVGWTETMWVSQRQVAIKLSGKADLDKQYIIN